MRKIITCLTVFTVSLITFGQEAGKAGTFIKNEATNLEMNQSIQNFVELGRSTNTSTSTNSNTGRNNTINRASIKRTEGRAIEYQWNHTIGTSEVFLRIPERGYYTVTLDDQMISSLNGKYRFYDVTSGRNILSIYENGYLIYKVPLNVQNNTRVILDFFDGFGLYLLDNYSLRNSNYGFDEWDEVWNKNYRLYNNGRQVSVMNKEGFDSFLKTMNRNAFFDEDKILYVRQQMSRNYFTSVQIQTIISKLSFDKNKVILAKELYHYCSDPNNYFIVFDSFTFRQYRNEVMDYVSRLNK